MVYCPTYAPPGSISCWTDLDANQEENACSKIIIIHAKKVVNITLDDYKQTYERTDKLTNGRTYVWTYAKTKKNNIHYFN